MVKVPYGEVAVRLAGFEVAGVRIMVLEMVLELWKWAMKALMSDRAVV